MALSSVIKDFPRRRRHVKTDSFATAVTKRSRSTTVSSTISKVDLKRNTRSRRIFAFAASFSYLLAFIFLLLVLLGNTADKPVLGQIYFFRLDLADIFPASVNNAQLINSIARSLGLHDFYQVGLWNFCEGYNDEGITYCSTPQKLYWFNPVEILLNELLAGATIALPSAIVQILGILKLASNLMFGFFLAAACVSLAFVFASPLPVLSRWWSLPLAALSGLAALVVVAASTIASVISFVFVYAATAQSALNIGASVGGRMFACMWLAAGFAVLGFVIHSGMGCCCTSRRDLVSGRRPVRHVSVKRADGGEGEGEKAPAPAPVPGPVPGPSRQASHKSVASRQASLRSQRDHPPSRQASQKSVTFRPDHQEDTTAHGQKHSPTPSRQLSQQSIPSRQPSQRSIPSRQPSQRSVPSRQSSQRSSPAGPSRQPSRRQTPTENWPLYEETVEPYRHQAGTPETEATYVNPGADQAQWYPRAV